VFDKIEVITKLDELNFVRYDFWFHNMSLYLDGMYILSKKSRRHKLVLDHANSYSRINQRNYGIKEEPDIDIEIQLEALRLCREKIGVKRWK